MSVTTSMYALRPIVNDLEIKGTSKMYNLRSIHDVKDRALDVVDEQVKRLTKIPQVEVQILEARQEKILKQLNELREQITRLCNSIKTDNVDKKKACSVKSTSNNAAAVQPIEIIVNANPAEPPVSLLALRNIWQDTDVQISSFKHSSVKVNVPKWENLKENNRRNKILVTLIWKNVSQTELVLPGINGHKIFGEENILRFLSRATDGHNYEKLQEADKIDRQLDVSYNLKYAAKKEEIVKSILPDQSATWLLGKKNPNIDDLALWSALTHLDYNKNKCPKSFTKWLANCDSVFLRS